ncbi:MAG: fibrillarin-like rRNA/tRNA 2'-O-methyltransferase [Candidatus Woesearchaeota archaeon]|nr:MAG: fibrillarin-like rRNA/tRNA 2'-O-methyltransferase [Candidatus Woesearchaeota archaeon]
MERKFNRFLVKRTKEDIIYFVQTAYPQVTPFQEPIIQEHGISYRGMSAYRSKLLAALEKGLSQLPFKKGTKVLYLGASHGYTPSIVSDLVGDEGEVFAVEFAPTVIKDLVILASKRKNIAPILADAFHPERYQEFIHEPDVVFMDIAQRNQIEIFEKNIALLKKGGFGMLSYKARSVDIKQPTRVLIANAKKELSAKYNLVDYKILDPFEKDHAMFLIKK